MPDYSKAKIYTLRCYTNQELIYVGSTVQDLCERFASHRRDSIKWPDRKLYHEVFKSGWKNWYIELYELFPCSSKEELKKREGEIQRLIGTLNMRMEARTYEEMKELQQKYRDENRDLINQKQRKYIEQNKESIICECGCEISKRNKARHIQSQKHIKLMNN